MLEGIERGVHVGLVGCPNHHIPVVLVEQRHRALELGRIAAADYFDAAQLQPRVVGILQPKVVELEHGRLVDILRHRDRAVHANAQVSLLADFIQQIHLVITDRARWVGADCGGAVNRLHARHAQFVGLVDGRAQGGDLFGMSRLRQNVRHKIDGGRFEDACRLARSPIHDDGAGLRSARAPADARFLEGLRIGPRDLAVLARQQGRTIGHGLVQHLSSGHVGVGEQLGVPVASKHPRARRHVFGVVVNLRFDVVQGRGGREVELIERESAGDQVDVRVVQTREDARALSVEDDGLRAAKALHVAVGADAKDLIAADGDGFLSVGAVAGVDLPVQDDQIDRAARIVTLSPDNEARDERRADNDDHQNRGQSSRHFSGF